MLFLQMMAGDADLGVIVLTSTSPWLPTACLYVGEGEHSLPGMTLN